MVNIGKISVLLLGLIAGITHANEELSYRDYQRAIGAGQDRLDYSKKLVGHDQLHTLIPSEEAEGEASDPYLQAMDRAAKRVGGPDRPEPEGQGSSHSDSNKGDGVPDEVSGEAEPSSDRTVAEDSEPDTKAPSVSQQNQNRSNSPGASSQASNAYYYVSPSLKNSNGRGQRNNARDERSDKRQIVFGISVGTTIPVSLDRSASNIQPGLIALTVDKTIRGRKEDLPVGSTLFSRSSAVLGSERLFLSVSRGVTPEGEEFNVQGVVFDRQLEPGLSARVVSDGKALARAGAEGVNTLSRELLNAAPTAGAGGEAAEATLGQLLQEKEKTDAATQGRPAYVVVASPQKATVQIENTF